MTSKQEYRPRRAYCRSPVGIALVNRNGRRAAKYQLEPVVSENKVK